MKKFICCLFLLFCLVACGTDEEHSIETEVAELLLEAIVEETISTEQDESVNAKKIKYKGPCSIKTYNGANGTVDKIESKKYEEKNGELNIWSDIYTGANQTIERRILERFNQRGDLVYEDIDNINEGIADWQISNAYTYGPNKTERTTFDLIKNQLDSRKIDTFDEKGNMVSTANDIDGDGYIDFQIFRHFDDFNNVVFEQYDENGDGYIDSEVTTDYFYDGNHNVLVAVTDGKGRVTQTFDSDNNVKTREFDIDGNNVAEVKITFSYDNNGNKIMETREYSNPDKPLLRTVYGYECW